MDVVEGEPDWATVAGALAPGLLRLAVMLTGSTPDAEDLLQATFARAQRHSRRIVAMAAPAAYLRTIMVNEHVSERRRRRLRTVPLEHDVPMTPPSEVEYDVWGWLATLSRQQRAALVLRFYEDLPDAEIAAVLGCSAATVRSHVSRGLASLRAALVTEEIR
jgi:RNA polymerase sigma-70 factor (sigma-E family)